ncbi:thioesterase family protein [Novosphingobium flavum]|uniref:acyl-CoA thioesterase n=1 Tax=Novosphingobium aerophilum TaxID=2839843 RepID=UPI00163A6EB3|nr:acyl-CoA thioesterase domain-containing protein [Novosphingobium aerophilum]MBC2663157.1 thioesterase family protein [Novosphingobium aerophilum]
MSFAEVLASARPEDDGFAVTVPESWFQGRTAYGGFSAALALAAARRIVPDLPPLRTGVVSFVGPTAGTVRVRARLLRRGRNAAWVESRVESEAGTTVTATFCFMAAVASNLQLDLTAPPADLIPPDRAVPALTGGFAPAFASNHLEMRHALPRGTAPRAELCLWARARAGVSWPGDAGEEADPMLALVLLGDALPPAVMPLIAPTVPVSSMTWQFNLLTAAPRTSDGWWLLRSTADYAANGCASQHMQVWNSAGEPMVAGMQAIAVFG